MLADAGQRKRDCRALDTLSRLTLCELVLVSHLLLRSHVAQGLCVGYAASHTLATHLRGHSHPSTRMLSAHSCWAHARCTRLHTHHCGSLMWWGCDARMHLHWLSHVLSWIRAHSRVTMGHAWVHASRRGLIRGHHVAALRERMRAGVGDACSSAEVEARGRKGAKMCRRPESGRAAVSGRGQQCIE